MNMGRIILPIALVMSISACASVTRGTKEVLVVESDPSGAVVSMSNGETCITPCSIKMKRKHGVFISITKEGYKTVETVVNTEVAGAGAAGMAGNVLLGGIIGAGVDASNGSLNKFVPNPLQVTMTPLAEGEAAMVPVTAQGESFHFKTYREAGKKQPFDSKERKKAEKEAKKAAAAAKKAEAKARKAEAKAKKEAAENAESAKE